jgi:inorganic pyrophosphatase
MTPLNALSTYDPETGDLTAVVETPKGCRNKYNYDPERTAFRLGKVLPAGTCFPFDFGFIPSTQGEDGDPLDVLILMDEPAFPGCLLPIRLLGVIEAEQTERDGETTRNDRLIAVATNYRQQTDLKKLKDLDPGIMDEIEHFFISYNSMAGKEFKPEKRSGPKRAYELVSEGQDRFAHSAPGGSHET